MSKAYDITDWTNLVWSPAASTGFFLVRFIKILNAELNPICHLLALLGAHHILHVSRIRVKWSCFVVSVWEIVLSVINTLNAELNPICHLLALLGAQHILHISRIRVNIITYLSRSVLLRLTHPDSALPYTVMLCPVHRHNIGRGVPNHEPFSIHLFHPPSETHVPSSAPCIPLSLPYRSFKISRILYAKKFSGAISRVRLFKFSRAVSCVRLFKSADISETYCLRH